MQAMEAAAANEGSSFDGVLTPFMSILRKMYNIGRELHGSIEL
ncbi:hypothetical protein P4H65_12045 [Paenibacillus chitinolyticus]|nr:hypothetical protein [Paenibacillus chitinolyticus]MEC0246519.1 hypothetical protein [Paenibacillus chitinolyticus]